MFVKVNSKGQITIPKSYRKSLNISPGDNAVVTESEGQLILRPVSETIFDMRGVIEVDEPQDLEAVLETTKQNVAHKFVESGKETIFDFFGIIPPTEGSANWEDIRAEVKKERAEIVSKSFKNPD